MASKFKSQLVAVLKFTVAALLITYLIKAGHLDVAALVRLMTPLNVSIGLLLVGVNTMLLVWRWLFLLRARGFQPSIPYVSSLYFIGMFFNYALPGAVGGDVVKAFYLVRDHRERRMDAILSILIDRILGLYTYFILTMVAIIADLKFILSHDQIRWVALSCSLVFAGMTVFFMIGFSNRLQKVFRLDRLSRLSPRLKKIEQVMHAFQQYGRSRKVIVGSVLVSLASQLTIMLFFFGVGQALGETDVSWKAYLFSVPMGFLCTALPVAPAGVGVGQVAFHYLFQAYMGRDSDLGTLSITACQIAVLAWSLLGAYFYVRYHRPTDDKEILE